jgi:hypothetical protein
MDEPEILFFSPKLAFNQNIEILLEFKNLSSVVSDLQLEIFFFFNNAFNRDKTWLSLPHLQKPKLSFISFF